MSAVASTARLTPSILRTPSPVALRLLAFAALAGFCLAHYALLVEPTAVGRVVGLAVVATAAGAGLAASARIRGRPGTAARVLGVAVLAVAALTVTGLAPRLLLPGNWSELADGLSRGFAGLDTFQWPYADGDPWVRLTILLAMPLLAVPAAVLAFWPARRAAAPLRAAAVAPLVVAYGMGVTDLGLGGWAARGSALLVLIAAYLWLPRLRSREALAACGTVAACCVAALPLAAGLNAQEPWLDYRHWDWFSKAQAGTTFGWDHLYGPIAWSRTGVKLLDVRSKEGHYWKAETLDRFDGLRWMHSESAFRSGEAADDIPQPIPKGWDEEITVTVRHLQTKVVVGAGSIYRVDSDRVTNDEPDGTVRVLDSPLREGDTYRVHSYVPDPTAEQMRSAPHGYPQRLAEYTFFDLPSADQSGLDSPDLSASARSELVTPRTIQPATAGAPLTAEQVRRVRNSPYGRVYGLAQRLAAGEPTTYDVVKAVEGHLQRGFAYSEKPPARRYPLAAFLFEDKIGYCQQFSGAMALMLRMDGIPARVATGFSPGALNRSTREYEVRDLDAHSWVEVWFTGIGWVPFDPTPSLAPAGSQSSSRDAASAARGGRGESTGVNVNTRQREGFGAGGGAVDEGGSRLWLVLLLLGLAGSAAFAALWLAGILRARPHFAASPDGAVQELRAALDRLGYSYPPRTTLSELERRLRVTSGEPAARYVRVLRSLRYAPPGAASPPTERERRELRRSLTAGGGPLARLRGLVVLPPRPRRRAH